MYFLQHIYIIHISMYIMYINVAKKTISMRKDYIICSDLIMMPVFVLFISSDVSSSLNSTYIVIYNC